jgi:predicted DNA-binding protein (MmcQ/YjbR family)
MASACADAEVERHLRSVCLCLPEVIEKPFGGHTAPSFRVRDKIFLMTSEDRGHLTCKAPPGLQQVLVGSNPDRFFVPAYVGSKGWVGIRLDAAVDWGELAELAEESYRMIAPKSLVALLDRQVDDQ